MSNIVFTFLFHCKNPLCNAIFPFLMEEGKGEREGGLDTGLYDEQGILKGMSYGENTGIRKRSGGFDKNTR